MGTVLSGWPFFIPFKYYGSRVVPLSNVLHIEQEIFFVDKASRPRNALEESVALKNIVVVSCRHGCLLILSSSLDSVSQYGLIGLAWKEQGIK